MNKDTVIGIVGAVILLAAMVGIFQYEGARDDVSGTGFDVAWVTDSSSGPSASGTLSEGDTAEEVLDVRQRNLTAVEVTVTWGATLGENTLSVTVTPPAGSGLGAETQTGSDGDLTFTFNVPNEVPADTVAFSARVADADAALDRQYGTDLGTGPWTVAVTFTEATGPLGLPVGGDLNVDWTAETRLSAFAPEFTER